MKDLSGHAYTYYPGQSIEIPVEGGGTMVLKGEIFDHKPRVMDFGIPLEPSADQVIPPGPFSLAAAKC